MTHFMVEGHICSVQIDLVVSRQCSYCFECSVLCISTGIFLCAVLVLNEFLCMCILYLLVICLCSVKLHVLWMLMH